jgi:hypothetical protein
MTPTAGCRQVTLRQRTVAQELSEFKGSQNGLRKEFIVDLKIVSCQRGQYFSMSFASFKCFLKEDIQK